MKSRRLKEGYIQNLFLLLFGCQKKNKKKDERGENWILENSKNKIADFRPRLDKVDWFRGKPPIQHQQKHGRSNKKKWKRMDHGATHTLYGRQQSSMLSIYLILKVNLT